MLPLYGFLEGDALGLVILAEADETVLTLAERLRDAATVRVPRRGTACVWRKGQLVDPELTLAQAGFEPLERFDVTQREDS